jgi:hypothetical protein
LLRRFRVLLIKTMQLEERKQLLVQLGSYMMEELPAWQQAKQKAYLENSWFIPEFVNLSIKNIAENYLQKDILDAFALKYQLPEEKSNPKKVGIVMAGNIPLVGFHDFLCVFISGHFAYIKPSSKDSVLIKHLVNKMNEWNEDVTSCVQFGEMLKGCDAYIATGSSNTGRYFEYYFQKYPHIIRKNRTSVAVLKGNESKGELEKLADDVYQYFGLGCRNVTKLYVPKDYDFVPLLEAFKKYDRLADFQKYKNNYDYNLAILLLNNRYYMTNGSILLVEDPSLFSPISQLHFEYYNGEQEIEKKLHDNETIQCIVSDENTGFGSAQKPSVLQFADGIDTMKFLQM